jgi:adenosylmethionine-8-amino-7-oxononanoate aminotransferase
MAVQYWLNKGVKGRNKFISFRHGYHGDTMACMSLCDPDEGMHAHFKGWLPEQILAELPCSSPLEGEEAKTWAYASKPLVFAGEGSSSWDQLLQHEKHRTAAVIIEPLVQGAGGMKFHDAATLKCVADLCSKHGVLLIADEVFTGFGRTGTMFACEQAEIVPDIMCLGKALTGGAMTLAATLAREHVFDAFWSDDPKAALMHGPTYMANPLACAAANASLDVFEREPRLQQVKTIEAQLREGLEPCRKLPGVVDVRVLGAIGVVQMDRAVDAARLKQAFIERGVWIRPFGDIIYLTPAFTIGEGELRRLIEMVIDVVRQA